MGANLAYSTYLKDGFTPFAISSDPQGNVYVAGSAVVDAVSLQTSVAVAKVDPTGSHYSYFTLLDSAAEDHVTSIAADSTGNAYIAGWTTNPNFSATGGSLGTAPSGSVTDPRSFVAKLNPDGSVAFAVLLGGSVSSKALGIALTASGQILVSGLSDPAGFPSVPSLALNSFTATWYLTELDASASKVVFTVPNIGGSSLAVDAQGNIYMAGSTPATNYPTTPGAYQTKFSVVAHVCAGFPCQSSYPDNQQHVTKVDPTGSKVLYSTGLNEGTNTGLAVDSAGNAYVTSLSVNYFNVPFVKGNSGYLSKLDPTGSSVLFSIPAGGAGVQVDSSGAVYVGGLVTTFVGFPGVPLAQVVPPPVFSQVPNACWPSTYVATDGAYVMKVDPGSGNVLDAQWIDGSAPGATAIALAGGKVWLTGTTPFPDVPYTPGALSPANLLPGPTPGAYLAAVDFSQPASSQNPAIACVLDQGNMMHVGAVAPLQLITLFGTNLGPAQGMVAPDGTDTSLAGVSVSFNGKPAPLFYVSASQINVAVPVPTPTPDGSPQPPFTVMQVTMNGSTIQRQFPFTASNLNLFADLSGNSSCANAQLSQNVAQPLATNADGSVNSCANPAKSGSTVSFYAHGAGTSLSTGDLQVASNCPAAITQVSQINAFVSRIDVQVSACGGNGSVSLRFSRAGTPVGPLALPPLYLNPYRSQLLAAIFPPVLATIFPAQALPMVVWVTP
jgi:uncharacterized protein (TIGR03437 family)